MSAFPKYSAFPSTQAQAAVQSNFAPSRMDVECKYENAVRLAHNISPTIYSDAIYDEIKKDPSLLKAFEYVIDYIMKTTDAKIMEANEIERKRGDHNAMFMVLPLTVAEEHYPDDKRFYSHVTVKRNTGECAFMYGPIQHDVKSSFDHFPLNVMLKMPATLARLETLLSWRGYLQIDICNATTTSTDKSVRANRRFLSVCLRIPNRRHKIGTISL